MAGATSTKTWVKFFTEAGIPDSAAATYALTFAENRIRTNMLLELNKEYLKDMGISLMGDVIAILRHAKNVHEQQAREKVLSTSPRVTSASSKADLSHGNEEDEITAKKPPPAIRVSTNDFNEHKVSTSFYAQETRAVQPMTIRAPGNRVNTNDNLIIYEESTLSNEKEARETATFTVRVPEKKKRAIAQVKCQPTTVRPFHSDDEEMDLVEKDFYVPMSSVQTATTVSTTSGKPPAKKAKIVISTKKTTPEHTAVSKKTVFERLGGEKSNNPVPSTGPSNLIKKGTITVTCNTEPLNAKKTVEKKSVFSRLGSKTDEEETTPVVAEVSPKIAPEGPALPYAGILKQTTLTKNPKKKIVKKIITMRADEPKVPVHLRAKSPKLQTVMKKISGGIPIIRCTVASNINRTTTVNKKTNTQGIFGSYVNPSKVTVKERLGVSQTLKLVPKKEVIHVGKDEYEEYDSGILDMDDDSGNRFSADGLSTKKVTFGGVTQKSIPGRLSLNAPVKPVGRGSITMRTGVFSRLGMATP